MKFICVGDLALGDHPKAIGHGVYSRYGTGLPESRACRLFPEGLSPDFIFGNLEYDLSQDVLSGNGLRDLQCRGVRGYADFLGRAGFTIVNMANNHIHQYGGEAYDRTVSHLRKNNISVCGVKDDLTGRNAFVKNGKRVGFLGWSQRPRQHFDSKPLYNEFDESRYQEDIRSLREKVDVLIVSMHWGDEFIQIPSEFEERIGRGMIDAGANAVIGHHPHVLRRIEEYKGGLIAYSLGNFICDMTWEERTSQTGALYFEIENNKVVCWSFHPAMIGADFFPEYLSSEDAERFMNGLEKVFNELKVETVRHGYADVAQKELRRHKAASFKYFIRNLRAYRKEILCQILFGAVADRLKLKRGGPGEGG